MNPPLIFSSNSCSLISENSSACDCDTQSTLPQEELQSLHVSMEEEEDLENDLVRYIIFEMLWDLANLFLPTVHQ